MIKTASRLASDLKIQGGERKSVLVLSVHISDSRIGLLQLSLAQFDDRAQSQLITALGEAEAQVGFFAEFGGDTDPLKRRVRGQPGSANVAYHHVVQVAGTFRGSLGIEICFRSLCGEQESVKDRNIHVDSDSPEPTGSEIVGRADAIDTVRTYWSATQHAQCVDGRQKQVALSATEFLRCHLVIGERLQIRTLLQGEIREHVDV